MNLLKRPVPAWILLVGLIVAASLATAFVFAPTLLAPKPDFELSASPSSQTLLAWAQQGDFDVQVTSVNNFSGIISAKVDHQPGLAVSFYTLSNKSPDAIPLYHSVTIHVVVNPTMIGNYSVTVTVSSGKLSHSVGVPVVVQGLGVSFSPNPLNVPYGSRRNETLTITSENGFSGNLTVGASVSGLLGTGAQENSVVVDHVFPTIMKLPRGGMVSTLIGINATVGDWCAANLCAVAGSSDVSVSIGARGNLGIGGSISYAFREVINESLTMPHYIFYSGTNMTANVMNTGSNPVLIDSYTVTDPHGNQYFGYPAVYPLYVNAGSTVPVNILIGAACQFCTLNGSPFTFDSGQSYTISIITHRSNHFTFNVTR